jgi:hypothetical protein
MKTISSKQTFFIKKVFPAIWMGVIVFVVVTAIAAGALSKTPFILVGPVFMLAIGFIVFKKFLWDLADEVRDGGDFLIVRRGSVEERVQLSDIMNVGMSQFTNPPRLSLRLRKPCKFGDEIVFSPPRTSAFNPFARNAIAEDLIQRVDRARREDARR